MSSSPSVHSVYGDKPRDGVVDRRHHNNEDMQPEDGDRVESSVDGPRADHPSPQEKEEDAESLSAGAMTPRPTRLEPSADSASHHLRINQADNLPTTSQSNWPTSAIRYNASPPRTTPISNASFVTPGRGVSYSPFPTYPAITLAGNGAYRPAYSDTPMATYYSPGYPSYWNEVSRRPPVAWSGASLPPSGYTQLGVTSVSAGGPQQHGNNITAADSTATLAARPRLSSPVRGESSAFPDDYAQEGVFASPSESARTRARARKSVVPNARSVTGKRPRSRSIDSRLETSTSSGRDTRGKRVRRSRGGTRDEPREGDAQPMDELDGLTSTVTSHLLASSAQESTRSTSHDLGELATTSAVPPLPALFSENTSETTLIGTDGTQDLQGYAAHPIEAGAPAHMTDEPRTGAGGEPPATTLVTHAMGATHGEFIMGDSVTIADGRQARERSLSYFSAASGGEDSGPMNVDRPTQAVEPEQSAVVDQAMQSPPTSTSQDLGEDLYGAAAVQPGHSSQMLAEANEAWILEAQDVFASVEVSQDMDLPQPSPVLAGEALGAAESPPAVFVGARVAQEATASVADGIPSTRPSTPLAPAEAAPSEPAAGHFGEELAQIRLALARLTEHVSAHQCLPTPPPSPPSHSQDLTIRIGSQSPPTNTSAEGENNQATRPVIIHVATSDGRRITLELP